MNPYRQGKKIYWQCCLTLVALCAVWILACSSQVPRLTGSWLSAKITHPSPFFAETLATHNPRNIDLYFDQAGGYVWRESQGVCHLGNYLIQDDALVLTSSHAAPITLGYNFRGGQLQIKSPDGFLFVFRRASEDDHAAAKPCHR